MVLKPNDAVKNITKHYFLKEYSKIGEQKN